MNVSSVLDRFQEVQVCLIGDVMIDSYYYGEVHRISPEAPVPVVQHTKRENRLGGAANVALNLKALGAHTKLVSVVGQDERGELLKKCCEDEGISSQYLYQSPHRKTTIKTRIIAGSQHLIRVDEEDTHDLLPDEVNGLLKMIESICNNSKPSIIALQDYNKGVLSDTVIHSILNLARDLKIPVIVDPKFKNFFSYHGATLFKPNWKEFQDALGRKIPLTKADLSSATRELRNKMQLDCCMVTLGEHGIFIQNDHEEYWEPGMKIDLVDVCGAGDSVFSMASCCLSLDVPIHETAWLCNKTGALVCSHLGVVPINKLELLQSL